MTTREAASTLPLARRRGLRKVIGASLIGTSLEWYDFFLYGHYGDRVGRRRIVVITLIIMGAATFLIGCLPTYDDIGVAAPILLGYQLAGVLGGALAPIIAVALLDRFDSPYAISVYVLAALLVRIAAVLVARETAAMELTADQAPEEVAAEEQRATRPRPVLH